MSYFLWVPVLIITLFFSAWFSVKNNQCQNGHWLTYLWLYSILTSLIPVWPLISKSSKNLVFDSLLYDAIICITYTVSIIILTGWEKSANGFQLAGIILIIIGFILMKF